MTRLTKLNVLEIPRIVCPFVCMLRTHPCCYSRRETHTDSPWASSCWPRRSRLDVSSCSCSRRSTCICRRCRVSRAHATSPGASHELSRTVVVLALRRRRRRFLMHSNSANPENESNINLSFLKNRISI